MVAIDVHVKYSSSHVTCRGGLQIGAERCWVQKAARTETQTEQRAEFYCGLEPPAREAVVVRPDRYGRLVGKRRLDKRKHSWRFPGCLYHATSNHHGMMPAINTAQTCLHLKTYRRLLGTCRQTGAMCTGHHWTTKALRLIVWLATLCCCGTLLCAGRP